MDESSLQVTEKNDGEEVAFQFGELVRASTTSAPRAPLIFFDLMIFYILVTKTIVLMIFILGLEPEKLLAALAKYSRFLKVNSEEDAVEALSHLLAGISNGLKRYAFSITIINLLLITINCNKSWNPLEGGLRGEGLVLAPPCDLRYFYLYRKGLADAIDGFIYGELSNCLQCVTCSWKSIHPEQISHLNLTIHPRTSPSISSCLDEFFKSEVIDGAWNCPKCQTIRSAEKRFQISKLPPIFIISYRRVELNFASMQMQRVHSTVTMPSNLIDLKPYATTEAAAGDTFYMLFAIVVLSNLINSFLLTHKTKSISFNNIMVESSLLSTPRYMTLSRLKFI